MLHGLLDKPCINDTLMDLLVDKINQEFIIKENFESASLLFINHIDESLFINPKTIYAILNANYIVKIGDTISITFENSSETYNIKGWNDFKEVCSQLNRNDLEYIKSKKGNTEPEFNYENLLKTIINQCSESLIKSLINSNNPETYKIYSNVANTFKNKPLNEQIQVLLENFDEESLVFVKKFVQSYDLIYLMLLNLKHYLKDKPEDFEKIYSQIISKSVSTGHQI